MKFKITWLNNGFVQIKELVQSNCRYKSYTTFTMNSLIYKAIENNSFILELGQFGKHPFKIEEIPQK